MAPAAADDLTLKERQYEALRVVSEDLAAHKARLDKERASLIAKATQVAELEIKVTSMLMCCTMSTPPALCIIHIDMCTHSS